MKRKMLNRLMAASIAAVMTVGMTGCGGNAGEPAGGEQTGGDTQAGSEEQGGETKTDTVEQGGGEEQSAAEEDDGMPEVRIDPETGEPFDLGGMEIIIADWWTGDPEEPKTDFQAAQREYQEWLQDTYNFTMVQKNYAGWGWEEGSIGEAFVQAATSGTDENIIYTLTNSAATAADVSQGLMYDLTKLDGDVIDLSAEKWQINGEVNSWKIGDSVYCFYTGPSEPRAACISIRQCSRMPASTRRRSMTCRRTAHGHGTRGLTSWIRYRGIRTMTARMMFLDACRTTAP